MERRDKGRSQGLVASPTTGGLLPGVPVEPDDRRVTIVSVVLRNAVAVAGMLFLGWSASEIVLLYFLDTLVVIWGIFTAVIFLFGDNVRQSWFDRAYWWATALALSAFVTIFMAIPLGMPVVFVAAASSWGPLDALVATEFRLALVTVAIAGLAGAVYRSFHGATDEASLVSLKWEFTLVFGRWFAVMAIVVTVGFLFLQYAAAVMVIVYSAIAVITELYPDRFIKLFDSVGKR